MTTYNGASFLREQLDSIFAQTRLPDELIVCDDCSRDQTAHILHEYAARAPFEMKVIVNDENLGSIKNFEKAIGLCAGDLIALCDQDDVWRPRKLAVLESAFAEDAGLGLAFSNADLIDEKGAPVRGELWAPLLNRKRQRAMSGSLRYDVLLGLPVTTGATMAFRSRFKSLVLPMPTGCPTFIHDRWIATLIAGVARFAVINQKLVAYRLHRRQQIGIGPPLPLKVFIPHRCWSDAVALAAIDERLRRNSWCSTDDDFRRSLAKRQRHTAARLVLSRNPFGRLIQVTTEFLSGRYILYPYGFVIAIQDLLVGTAADPDLDRAQPAAAQPSDCAPDSGTEVCEGRA